MCMNYAGQPRNIIDLDIPRCLLSEAKVNRRFWSEIVRTGVYLKSRKIVNIIENKTLFEIVFITKTSIECLRLYGSSVCAIAWSKKGIKMGLISEFRSSIGVY